MSDLSLRARRCVKSLCGDAVDPAVVAAQPRSWFGRQPNVGETTVREIEAWLAQRGLTFAAEKGRIRRIPARHPIRYGVVWVRVTEAEKAVINERARSHGKSMAVYLRDLGLGSNLNRT